MVFYQNESVFYNGIEHRFVEVVDSEQGLVAIDTPDKCRIVVPRQDVTGWKWNITEEETTEDLLKEGGEIVKASHYNQHPSGVECWDIVEHMSYNLGNAIAYIWRSPHKGTPEKDLHKAIQHIQREIDRLKKMEKKRVK